MESAEEKARKVIFDLQEELCEKNERIDHLQECRADSRHTSATYFKEIVRLRAELQYVLDCDMAEQEFDAERIRKAIKGK